MDQFIEYVKNNELNIDLDKFITILTIPFTDKDTIFNNLKKDMMKHLTMKILQKNIDLVLFLKNILQC